MDFHCFFPFKSLSVFPFYDKTLNITVLTKLFVFFCLQEDKKEGGGGKEGKVRTIFCIFIDIFSSDWIA